MEGTYYKEWSAVLDRAMEFKVYGHGGVPVLALPARGGRFYDWENNGMPEAAARLLHEGKMQLFCTEKQSEDLARSLLAGFEDDPEKLWESNIFGKSLHELVNEGLQNKLLHMPQEARTRLQETLERVINEGCTGLICILI